MKGVNPHNTTRAFQVRCKSPVLQQRSGLVLWIEAGQTPLRKRGADQQESATCSRMDVRTASPSLSTRRMG